MNVVTNMQTFQSHSNRILRSSGRLRRGNVEERESSRQGKDVGGGFFFFFSEGGRLV